MRVLAKKKDQVLSDVDTELIRLRELSMEHGSQAGLFDMPVDSFSKALEAELRVLSLKRFGPFGPNPNLLLEKEVELQKRCLEIEEKANACLSQLKEARPWSNAATSQPSQPHWHAVSSTAIVFALLGLGLMLGGAQLGWMEWLFLALSSALLILNLSFLRSIPRYLSVLFGIVQNLTARCGIYLSYRRFSSQIAELKREITELGLRRTEELEHRNRIDEWVAQTRELVLGHFNYHKDRGKAAAQLAG